MPIQVPLDGPFFLLCQLHRSAWCHQPTSWWVHSIPWSVPLIKVLKSTSPKTDPCGTPLMTGLHLDAEPLTTTFRLRPSNQLFSRCTVQPNDPSSLCRSPSDLRSGPFTAQLPLSGHAAGPQRLSAGRCLTAPSRDVQELPEPVLALRSLSTQPQPPAGRTLRPTVSGRSPLTASRPAPGRLPADTWGRSPAMLSVCVLATLTRGPLTAAVASSSSSAPCIGAGAHRSPRPHGAAAPPLRAVERRGRPHGNRRRRAGASANGKRGGGDGRGLSRRGGRAAGGWLGAGGGRSAVESLQCRIIELFDYEWTPKGHLVQLPCNEQGQLQLHQVLRAPPA